MDLITTLPDLPGRPLVPSSALPAIVAATPTAAPHFLEFFAARIRNTRTRTEYLHAARDLLTWLSQADPSLQQLGQISSLHVAAWIELRTQQLAAPTVKKRLAGVRMLFDWLVTRQVMPINPAAAVRGPRYSVSQGKTAALTAEETRQLLDSIGQDAVIDLRDCALIALMTFTFARVGAAVKMRVEDYFFQARRGWVRLHEKNGKEHKMVCHHKLVAALEAYIEITGIGQDRKLPLFRTFRGGKMTQKAMLASDVHEMLQRRARKSGIGTRIGCHTFRATGITEFLRNGGTLESAQRMANHADSRTTKLYDRRNDQDAIDEVERILI